MTRPPHIRASPSPPRSAKTPEPSYKKTRARIRGQTGLCGAGGRGGCRQGGGR